MPMMNWSKNLATIFPALLNNLGNLMPGRKLLSLEVMRGLAALFVLLFHTHEWLAKILLQPVFHEYFYFGKYGVDFFFVLSGFIIMYAHSSNIGKREDILYYLRRRFLRIFPTYWVVLGLVLMAYAAQGRVGEHAEFDLKSISKSFFLMTSEHRPVLVVSWTLSFELFFYLAFIVFFFGKKIGTCFFSIWALLIGINYFFPIQPDSWLLNTRHLEFMLGLIAAWIIKEKEFGYGYWILGITSILILLTIQGERLYPDLDFEYWKIYALLSFFLIIGLGLKEKETRIAPPKFLILLGSASYSIYLVHLPVILFSGKIIQNSFLKQSNPHILFILMAIVALASGLFFHLYIEKFLQKFFISKKIQKFAKNHDRNKVLPRIKINDGNDITI